MGKEKDLQIIKSEKIKCDNRLGFLGCGREDHESNRLSWIKEKRRRKA